MDTKRGPMEDLLPDVIREFEMRFLERQQVEEESRRSEAELDERWQRVLAEAEVRAIEAHRAEVLTARTKRWQVWQEQVAYVDGLEARLNELPDDERAAAEDWVAWSRSHFASTDPLLVRHACRSLPR